jgi:hypothetical protein
MRLSVAIVRMRVAINQSQWRPIAQRLTLDVKLPSELREYFSMYSVYTVVEQALCCETYAGASREIHAIQRLPADGWQTIRIREMNNERLECPSSKLDIWM